MSEHKFKVGDIQGVLTSLLEDLDYYRNRTWGPDIVSPSSAEAKAREITGIVSTTLMSGPEPIPATDAEVVERVARAICVETGRDPDEWQTREIGRFSIQGIAERAIEAALTSSGYTRSPKPDVNQMMLGALKATQVLVSKGALTGFKPLEGTWADELYANQAAISAAIAAGSGE